MSLAPSFHFENHAKENQDVFATRKAGLNSARKPLADKSVNNTNTSAVQSAKKINLTGAKPKIKEYPEWLFDGCSYNLDPVKETYNDIWPQPPVFNHHDVMKIICPPTPPPRKEVLMEPEIYDLPMENKFFFDTCVLQKKIIDDFDFPPSTFLF